MLESKINTIHIITGNINNNNNYIQSDNIRNKVDQIYKLPKDFSLGIS